MIARSTILSCAVAALVLTAARDSHSAAVAGTQRVAVAPVGGTVNWAQLGFDAGHSGENPFEKAISTKNVGQLQQAWSFTAGSGNTVGNVVEANGVVYAPSVQGTLYAIDAISGGLVWSFPSGTGFGSSGSAPAYDNGALFTVCTTSATTQGICALNASDGTLLWSYTFPGSAAYDGTPPVVAYGKVFFEGCATSCSYLALDELSGAVVLTVNEPQGNCEGNGGITPSVVSKLLYVEYTCAGTLGEFLALSVKNAKPKWIVTNVQPNAGLSVAHGFAAIVFQAASPPSQTLNVWIAKKGAFRWRNAGGAWYADTPNMPAVTKALVYVTRNNAIAAFSTTRGKLSWSTFPAVSTSWPSVANGIVYTACPGRPCAYDAHSGTPLWSGSGAPTYGVPIIVNGALYGACQGSNVCAWTLPPSLKRRR